MMGAAPAATSLLLIAFVCVRLPVVLILIFVLLLLRPMAATEAAAATRAVAVRCFWGAFANECDLDLSSWFIILRCLRSCCCRCRCRCRCCCCSCCCVCAFVLLYCCVALLPTLLIDVVVAAATAAVRLRFCI